ncbi:MAG: hypothetical protein HPY66_2964 [Firmicutes bacterium]|nr:hypothetical protein [Bacillota bacterium]
MRRKLALICATLLAVTLFITACKIHEDPKPKIIRLNNIDIYFEEASQASKPGPRRPETNPLFPIPEEVLLPQRKEEERPLLDFSNENIRYTNGKIMISLVEFCDALGIGMKWDGYTRTVNIVKDGIEICLNYGKNEAVVNGENVKLDSPMSNINGKTMIPLLDITSALKIETKWDEDTKILTIINYINKINNSDRLDNNLLYRLR